MDRCAEDGLIWGQELFADATLAEANADRDNMLPRFAFEAHLKRLFGEAYVPPGSLDGRTETVGSERGEAAQPEATLPVPELGSDLSPERAAALEAQNCQRHDWYARNGEPDRQAESGRCAGCPLHEKCTDNKEGRTITRSFFEEYLERVRACRQTEAYKKAYQKREVWVEPLFGEAQQWHGLRRFRLRGLEKVNCEGLMTATGQNLKRLLAARGWGRRHFPGGAPGVHSPPSGVTLCA